MGQISTESVKELYMAPSAFEFCFCIFFPLLGHRYRLRMAGKLGHVKTDVRKILRVSYTRVPKRSPPTLFGLARNPRDRKKVRVANSLLLGNYIHTSPRGVRACL